MKNLTFILLIGLFIYLIIKFSKRNTISQKSNESQPVYYINTTNNITKGGDIDNRKNEIIQDKQNFSYVVPDEQGILNF